MGSYRNDDRGAERGIEKNFVRSVSGSHVPLKMREIFLMNIVNAIAVQ